MKKQQRITLVGDEGDKPGDLFNELSPDEDARIDSLLRLAAEEATQKVDFERIKYAAIENAKREKQRKFRSRRAVSYAMFACAAFLIGFSVLTALGTLKIGKQNAASENKYAAGKVADSTIVPFKVIDATFLPDSYKVPEAVEFKGGSVSDSVEVLFPENLPDTMEKSVDADANHTSAEGVDSFGSKLGYDCFLTEAPADLEVGESGTVQDGDDLIYYLRMSYDECLAVRFSGFEKERADEMFDSLLFKIIELVPQPTEANTAEADE